MLSRHRNDDIVQIERQSSTEKSIRLINQAICLCLSFDTKYNQFFFESIFSLHNFALLKMDAIVLTDAIKLNIARNIFRVCERAAEIKMLPMCNYF